MGSTLTKATVLWVNGSAWDKQQGVLMMADADGRLGTLETGAAAEVTNRNTAIAVETTRATARENVIEAAAIASGIVSFVSPIMVDTDPASGVMVQFPSFDAIFPDGTIYQTTPAGFISVGATPGTQYRYFIDRSIITSANPVVLGGVNTGGAGLIPVGTALNGNFSSPHRVVKTTPNEFASGKTPGSAPYLFGTTAQVAVTDTQLTSRGFTLGAKAPDGNSFYGDVGPVDQKINPWFFFRVYVQTATADTFPTANAFLYDTAGTANQYNFVLERKFSPTAASFICVGQLTSGLAVQHWIAGSFAGAATWIFTGAQAAFSDIGPIEWVNWQDYPNINSRGTLPAKVAKLKAVVDSFASFTPDFILPDTLYLTAGKKATIRPVMGTTSRLSGARTYGLGSQPTGSYSAGNTSLATMLDESTTSELIVDPAMIGTTAEILIYDPSQVAPFAKTVAVVTAPVTRSGSPKVLIIADSLRQYCEVPNFLRDNLVAMGMTPTMIGTINAFSGLSANALCEGRGGRRFSDYTYATTDMVAPVAVGGEAAYLALSDAQRQSYNPFLRAAVGGDPSNIVFNGYVFDLAFYLTRFSLATPTHIEIALGTNDMASSDGLASGWIDDGLRVLYGQCRAAAPNAFMGITVQATGPSPTSGRWPRHKAILLTKVKQFVTAHASDAKLSLIPIYLYMSNVAGWARTVGTPDANGLASAPILDDIHFTGPHRPLVASVLASWIGGTLP